MNNTNRNVILSALRIGPTRPAMLAYKLKQKTPSARRLVAELRIEGYDITYSRISGNYRLVEDARQPGTVDSTAAATA